MKALFTAALVLVAISTLSASSFALLTITTTNLSVGGVGIGTILAIVLSWSRNNSVLWAILHGILSWIYVIYFVFTR